MPRKRRQNGAPYGNRVLGVEERAAGSLLANADNFRIHPRAQQDAMAAVLGEIGFIQGVIVNRRSHADWGAARGVETVLDGHLRVEQALSRGEETMVPVTFVDLSPSEERRALATFDAIGALAGTDEDKLEALLAQSRTDWPESTLDLDALFRRKKTHVSFEAAVRHNVLVECASEQEQAELLERLRQEGLTCRPTSRKA